MENNLSHRSGAPWFPLQISIAIVLVWPCRTNSDRCGFSKNTIRCRPMGYICRPSDTGSGGSDDTEVIQCIDGQEPQIHKLWCLVLDNITCNAHPTAQVEVGYGTMKEFTTDYLAENGRIIPIIGQLSINGRVQFFGHYWFCQGKWILVYSQPASYHWYHRLFTRWYLQSELGSYPRGTLQQYKCCLGYYRPCPSVFYAQESG